MKIYTKYNLTKQTTFKIGGKADFFCVPNSIEYFKEACIFAKNKNLPITVIGGGSNLLISDNGIRGLVISTKKLNKCYIEDNRLYAESGASIKKINKLLIKKALSGMEFTGGLPGSIGGAVYMNAKAYEGQLSDVVLKVIAVNSQGEKFEFFNKDINFSYKKSIFMGRNDLFIHQVVLELKPGVKSEIKNKYNKNIKDRRIKKQYKYPSAGCVFKNNYSIGIPTGKIIEELGLRKTKIGNAMISNFHGNFIINIGHAKAIDVKNLIEFIEDKVLQEKAIRLEREIKLLGF